jgi:hypothetical protein
MIKNGVAYLTAGKSRIPWGKPLPERSSPAGPPACSSGTELFQLREIFRRVRLEFFDAGFAAEFHFLTIIVFDDHFAHAAELIISHETNFERVGGGQRGGYGGGKDEEGQKNQSQFHGWILVGVFLIGPPELSRSNRVTPPVPLPLKKFLLI